MKTTRDDETLIAQLHEVFASEGSAPERAAIQAFHQVVNASTQEGAAEWSSLGELVASRPIRRLSLHQLRHPAAAAVGALVISVGGVAAAAVGTNTLPGPTRTIAYHLGLPVTSPALHSALGVESQLRSYLLVRDRTQATHLASQLRQDLGGLNAGDLSQIAGSAKPLLTSPILSDLSKHSAREVSDRRTRPRVNSTPTTLTTPSGTGPVSTTPNVVLPGVSNRPTVTIPRSQDSGASVRSSDDGTKAPSASTGSISSNDGSESSGSDGSPTGGAVSGPTGDH